LHNTSPEYFRHREPSPAGSSNARGYEKNRDFRPISRYISETIQDTAIVTME